MYARIPNKLHEKSVLPLAFSDNRIIENADRLIEMISDKGVDTFDFREQMVRDNIDFETAFFRNHFHWKYETILRISQLIGDHMNTEYGFNIDLSVWDIEQFDPIKHERTLHGAEAMNIGVCCLLKEDITFLSPKAYIDIEFSDTSTGYEVITTNNFFEVFIPKLYHGDLEYFICVDKGLRGVDFTHIVNNNVNDEKRVLVIADSYGLTWVPYFSLGIKYLDYVYLNHQTHTVIWDFLEGKEYDLVIFALSDMVVSLENQPMFEMHDRLYLGFPAE